MKTYENETETKRIWYDERLRLWTLQVLDDQKNQIGDVEYTPYRREALKWLNDVQQPMENTLIAFDDFALPFKVTDKDDEEGYYYIVDNNGVRVGNNLVGMIGKRIGYGNIKNKFVRVRQVYGRTPRIVDAKLIAQRLTEEYNQTN